MTHGAVAPPTHPPHRARRRTPGEEARTLAAGVRTGALATLTEDGSPWASVTTLGLTDAGEPVLVVSTLAEHGRNLARDPRASVVLAEPVAAGEDPLDHGRVTLAGTVTSPGPESDAGREALAAHPSARDYVGFADFTLYVLGPERIRWVGGFARMATVELADYAAAAPDPSATGAVSARAHLNEDHADAVLMWARTLGGYADATAAAVEAIDRHGADLRVHTPRGAAGTRVGFAAPAEQAGDLRAATIALTRAARAWSAPDGVTPAP